MTSLRVGGRTLDGKHDAKPVFPELGISRGELVRYYMQYAARILPYLRERAVGVECYPEGIDKRGFFRREPSRRFPDWIERADLPGSEGRRTHVLCGDAPSLLYLAGQGGVSLHAWLSRVEDPRSPTRLVIDVALAEGMEGAAVSTAWDLRALLEALGLDCLPLATGAGGLQLVVPLLPGHSFPEVRTFAEDVVRRLAARRPAVVTLDPRKARREGLVCLDVSRNAYAQLTVAPFSVRALPGAPVALPLDWADLEGGAIPRASLRDLLAAGVRSDPWKTPNVPRQRIERQQQFFRVLPEAPARELCPLAG